MQLASATPILSPLVEDDRIVHNPAWLEWFRRVDAIAQSASLTGALLKVNNLSDVASVATSRTNLGLGTGNSPQFTGLNLSGLTASQPVVTDGAKNLSSVSYATLANSLGLGPTSSPTFAGLTIDTLNGILRGNFGNVLTVSIGTSLSYNGTTLDTIQDIRTSASPTFVHPIFTGLRLTGLTALRLLATDGSTDVTTIASPANVNKLLHDGAPPAFSFVVEADISLSAVTTNDATTLRHGFLPQLSGNATQFLNGNGVFTTGISGAVAGYIAQSFTGQTSVTVTHNLNAYPLVQIIGTTNSFTVTHNSLNDFTVAFDVAATGTILATAGSPGIPQIATKVADYVLTADDNTILVNATATMTLPTAVGIAGRLYRIKRIFGGGPTTIATTASQTIDGQPSPLILTSQYDAIVTISDGANWLLF